MSLATELAPAVAIDTPESARDLVLRLADTMDKLLEAVERETALVRSGNLALLCELEDGKAELARSYVRDMENLKANAPYIGQAIPDIVAEFRRGYEQFRATLEVDLAVLATVHAVSDGTAHPLSPAAAPARPDDSLIADVGPDDAYYSPSGPTVVRRSW